MSVNEIGINDEENFASSISEEVPPTSVPEGLPPTNDETVSNRTEEGHNQEWEEINKGYINDNKINQEEVKHLTGLLNDKNETPVDYESAA
jgi:hypothetical protein